MSGTLIAEPRTYGGDLVAIAGLRFIAWSQDSQGSLFAQAAADRDTVTVYLDRAAGFRHAPDRNLCYTVTGIVMMLEPPKSLCPRPVWCVAPRSQADVAVTDCHSGQIPTTWGAVKAVFDP
ncbi:MAG: hypothetical protein WAW06_01075 [bacterium]